MYPYLVLKPFPTLASARPIKLLVLTLHNPTRQSTQQSFKGRSGVYILPSGPALLIVQSDVCRLFYSFGTPVVLSRRSL